MTSLRTEIEGMKKVFFDVVTKVQSMSNQNAEGMNENQNGTENTIHRRALRKHLICPYEQCDRRYSSQIALNCHLRTKHNEKKSRTWWNIRFINLFLLFRIWICYFLNLPAAWVINGPHEAEKAARFVNKLIYYVFHFYSIQTKINNIISNYVHNLISKRGIC